MINEIRNPQTGAVVNARSSFDYSTVTLDAHARYQEAVMRGNVFLASNQTGVTTQAGLSATTPTLTLYNPKGNQKAAVLIYAGIVFAVANAAAAVVWLAANTNVAAAAVTGTVAPGLSNAQIGNTNQPSCSAFTAATLPAAPIAIATLGVGLTGAITTLPYQVQLGRYFDGTVVVLPGGAISFQTSTASGANSAFADLIWEEIPLIALNQ